MAANIEFKKGDGITHYFKIPLNSWTAGGTLSFTAKETVDNDSADALAVIDKKFTDSAVDVLSDPLYAIYTLAFLPNDIKADFADGATKKLYLGEFQYIPSDGIPESFPGNDKFITTTIYADIKRGTI